MAQEYPTLTYPGDATKSEQAQPGQLLGWDELFTPYEVLDAEWIPGGGEIACTCDREISHTHVFLQRARPETMREQGDAYTDRMRQRGLL